MTTNPTSNGEFYDHITRQWYVMCGSDNVPIRKVDANGQPLSPPELEEPEQVSSS